MRVRWLLLWLMGKQRIGIVGVIGMGATDGRGGSQERRSVRIPRQPFAGAQRLTENRRTEMVVIIVVVVTATDVAVHDVGVHVVQVADVVAVVDAGRKFGQRGAFQSERFAIEGR